MTNKITNLFTGAIELSAILSKDKEEFIESYRQNMVVGKSRFLQLKESEELQDLATILKKLKKDIQDLAKEHNIILSEEFDLTNVLLEIKKNDEEVVTEVNSLNPKWEEIIVVAPRKELFEDESLTFQGVSTDKEVIEKVMNNLEKTMKPMRRGGIEDETVAENNAESNRDYKQPIPYPVIMRGDSVFVMERLEKGGESRLHGKLSVGAGGHMNPEDGISDINELVDINLQRELQEELSIGKGKTKSSVLGLINDDSDEVGQVHLGILVKIEVPKYTKVEVKETDQLKGSWMTLEQLKQEDTHSRLENWSKMAVDCLVGE